MTTQDLNKLAAEIREWLEVKFNSSVEAHRLAIGRMILAVHGNQTDEEAESGQTIVHNGEGWNGVDAEIMTSLADWFERKGFLTGKQASLAAKKLKKYSRQLAVAKSERNGGSTTKPAATGVAPAAPQIVPDAQPGGMDPASPQKAPESKSEVPLPENHQTAWNFLEPVEGE